MPENKPMKMQWITVDGRQVPSILPNHWNEQKNDWDITGTKNPLPIANYTQNASGVWLPTSESNPMPTRLTGSIVEFYEIFKNEIVPPLSTLSFFVTFKGKEFGINGRWEIGDNQATATYTYNEHKLTSQRFISDAQDLEVTNVFVNTMGNKRVQLTSPSVIFRVSNPTDKELKFRYVYITEYY